MVEQLKGVNNKYIEIYKNNPKELEKHLIIKEMLEKEDVFLNLEIEIAYSILRDLGIPEEELKNVYIKLLSTK